ncbi:MAG: plasmid pRiA4b ORF-3 family protein, partial [Hungatella sp.]
MMADVYKFKVKLCELENIIWRDIEITSVSSIAKLGYAVLAAVESTASHLFNIRFDGKRYEIVFEEDDFDDEPAIDPIRTKLSALKLSVGDKLSMEYDYGAGWKFEIELWSITEMKRGAGTHYPYVTDGKGKGIIEDTSPYELAEIVTKTDKDG